MANLVFGVKVVESLGKLGVALLVQPTEGRFVLLLLTLVTHNAQSTMIRDEVRKFLLLHLLDYLMLLGQFLLALHAFLAERTLRAILDVA